LIDSLGRVLVRLYLMALVEIHLLLVWVLQLLQRWKVLVLILIPKIVKIVNVIWGRYNNIFCWLWNPFRQVTVEIICSVVCKIVTKLPDNFQLTMIGHSFLALADGNPEFLGLFLVFKIPVLFTKLQDTFRDPFLERRNVYQHVIFDVLWPLRFVKELFMFLQNILTADALGCILDEAIVDECLELDRPWIVLRDGW
jgi:hypothetical protein